MKTACDKVDSRDIKLASNNVVVPEEVSKVDIALLLEKERNKILNQRTRDAKKATDKALREATRATTKAMKEIIVVAEKEAKKDEKPGKTKAITPLFQLTETSFASPSLNPCKQDASLAHLSESRL